MGSSSRGPDRNGAEILGQGRDFSAAFDSAFARAQVGIESACSRHPEWPDRVAAGLSSALDFTASDAATARILTVEAMSNVEGRARLRRMVEHFAEFLRCGRKVCPDCPPLPVIAETAWIDGLVSLVAQRLLSGEQNDLPAEAPSLIRFLLTPYIGLEQADTVARRHIA